MGAILNKKEIALLNAGYLLTESFDIECLFGWFEMDAGAIKRMSKSFIDLGKKQLIVLIKFYYQK